MVKFWMMPVWPQKKKSSSPWFQTLTIYIYIYIILAIEKLEDLKSMTID